MAAQPSANMAPATATTVAETVATPMVMVVATLATGPGIAIVMRQVAHERQAGSVDTQQRL